MNRSEAAAFVGDRYGAYLAAVNRTAIDSAGNLEAVIDDALRALGYAAADIPTAAPVDPEAEDDFRIQVAYRAMEQITRDLGAQFDVSIAGDSYRLSQMRAAAETDLAAAKSEVLARFRTLGIVGATSPLYQVRLNTVQSCWPGGVVS